jgi:tRNA (mo5U34)-methyltransferase
MRALNARLRELGWYHSIELPGGEVIEGLIGLDTLRARLAQFPIPEDLRGKRVLDIGAWDGWFSFEMERRGAEVLAIDSDRNTRFEQAKALLGSRVEHRFADITRIAPNQFGRFDYVLFFGVLYHLKHPLLALEKVCAMTTGAAFVESYVIDCDDIGGFPVMRFYETDELRGQLDNWVGPNVACVLALCRTAGFARVQLESVQWERAHVTCRRAWEDSPESGDPPQLLCVENAVFHNHSFHSDEDDYVSVYFRSPEPGLSIENLFPMVGPFGVKPFYAIRNEGDGWQTSFKLPPGLDKGWHDVTLKTGAGRRSAAVRIGVDLSREEASLPAREPDGGLAIRLVTDGQTWERFVVHSGAGASLSAWVAGLPADCDARVLKLRLNGTDLPPSYLAASESGEGRQVNALLPSALEPGDAVLGVVYGLRESEQVRLRIVGK